MIRYCFYSLSSQTNIMKRTLLLFLLLSIGTLASAQVVINEVIGSTTGTDTEFIELYNAGATTINISGWSIEVSDSDAGTGYGNVDATIAIPTSPALAPGEYCLLGSPTFTTVFGITPDIPFPDNTLENGSYTIILKNAASVIQSSAFVVDTGAGDMPNDGGTTITPDISVGPDGTFLPAGFTRVPDGGAATAILEFSPAPAPSATPMKHTTVTAGCVPISQVQGNGKASPMVNTSLTIKGIVVADTQGPSGTGLSGFFVQEEDADADADPLTSEGIFVFDGGLFTPDVNIGDLVEVTGTVVEFFDLTQIDVTAAGGGITITSSGNPLPTAASVDLPLSDVCDYEVWEGMRVDFVDDLYVTEHFTLSRYGEVRLSETSRLTQFTECNLPDAAGNIAHQLDAERRTIVVDDNREGQNLFPIDLPDGNNLTAANTLRGNDIVSNLTGVLDYRFDVYRVQPTAAATITVNNPRPATPPAVGGNIKVASVNVLNYFNGDGAGGGFPTARGAETLADFNRQKAKIAKAICAMDADIIGLQEIENDGFGATSAIQDLINAIAAECGTTYAFVDPLSGSPVGSDAICVALIYKTTTITESGTAAVLTSAPFTTRNRVPISQTFQVISGADTGEQLTVCVNHLKSKGSSCGVGDDDLTDGAGNCNGSRNDAAVAIAAWLAADPTGTGVLDQLIIGDLNANRMEDPIMTLEAAGFTNLAPAFSNAGDFPCDGAYSFVFNGQWGSLDHGMANGKLLSDITGVKDWHVNSDEPNALDYSTEFNDPSLYAADVFRFSDHDPLLIGLDLKTDLAGVLVSPKVFLQGPLTGTLMNGILNTSSLLPTTEPYTALGYSLTSGGGEMIIPSAMAITGNDAIEDWVIVELRDPATPTTIIASRAALLQRDGDVVDTDGVSPVCIGGTSVTAGGMYHVAVRHRNHLGVMTSVPVTLN